MFALHNVTRYFGSRPILKDVSFSADDGERIAIVGGNGAGKTTLMKIVAGLVTPDGGSVSYPKASRIAYLPQEVEFYSQLPLRDELRVVFKDIDGYLAEMAILEARMADVEDEEEFQRVAHRYDFLQGEVHRLDAYSIDAQIAETAAGLGFTVRDLDRACGEFSGGWRMRIALAKILLGRFDILLLDEPTNYLDLETMLWLEKWLRSSRATVAMVSHERAFMDRLVNRVVEIAEGEASIYRGNYSTYVEQRIERREQQRRAYENQQQKIGEIEKFITRFRYNASKAAMVQGRIKQLEKIERLSPPPHEPKAIHFNFPPAERANKEVLTLRGVSKRYGAGEVLKPFDLTVYRGERIALVGLNGAGKSTLLKMLAGVESPSTGERAVGTQITMEYFEQYQTDMMAASHSVLDEMQSAAPVTQAGEARSILGAFLFRGDDVDKPVRVLSGGEKTRLRLAKMLYSRANLLLLDEPTNHLDIASRETLEGALVRYTGTVVLVSHDRVFLNRAVNKVIEIRDGALHSYPGNYSDYLNATGGHGFLPEGLDGRLNAKDAAPGASSPSPDSGAGQAASENSSDGDSLSFEERKAAARLRKKQEREVERAEEEAHRLEAQIRAIEAQMAEPQNATNPAMLQKLVHDQRTAKTAFDKAYAEWERLASAFAETSGAAR